MSRPRTSSIAATRMASGPLATNTSWAPLSMLCGDGQVRPALDRSPGIRLRFHEGREPARDDAAERHVGILQSAHGRSRRRDRLGGPRPERPVADDRHHVARSQSLEERAGRVRLRTCRDERRVHAEGDPRRRGALRDAVDRCDHGVERAGGDARSAAPQDRSLHESVSPSRRAIIAASSTSNPWSRPLSGVDERTSGATAPTER